MKGLLRKDFYTTFKYMRFTLVIIAFFIAFSFSAVEYQFFIIFPIAFTGLVPMTLLSYDEKEKWDIYCDLLPVSRSEFVSAKYLIGLILEGVLLVIITLLLLLRTTFSSAANFGSIPSTIALCIIIGLVIPGFIMPFVFKFGTARGRIAYFIGIGAIYGILAAKQIGNVSLSKLITSIDPLVLILFAVLISIAIYACSWLLSIAFYKSKEL